MINPKKLQLNKTITKDILKQNGFRGTTYRCFVFKDEIELCLYIDLNDSSWYYQIINISDGKLYPGYYERDFGRSDVVKKIDKNLENILKEMIKQNIFVKKKKK